MKTRVTVEIEHDRPLPHFAEMLAGRAWTMPGVKHAEVVPPEHYTDSQGFTAAELALGRDEVVRG